MRLMLRRRVEPDEVDGAASRHEEAFGWRSLFGGDAEEDEAGHRAGVFTSISLFLRVGVHSVS